MADDKDEESEIKGGAADKEERSGARSRFKDVNKGESKSTTTEKSVEMAGNKVKVFCSCFVLKRGATKCFATYSGSRFTSILTIRINEV